MHYGSDIAARVSKSGKSKQANVNCSRKNHYLAWCNSVGARSAGADPKDIQARNFLLACYAVSLVRGETILSRRLRHATLKGYLKMACTCHTDQGLPSPRTAPTDFVKIVLDAVQKYEKVPNRKEMIHDQMYHHMLRLYKKYVQTDPDSLITSLCEWMFLGRYVGFRREEWCNEKSHEYTRIDDPLWDGPDARSIILEDFTFYDANQAPVRLSAQPWDIPLHDLPPNIAFVELCIRKQKNNDNYQKLIYGRCKKTPLLCPVRAAFRIYCRGRRLGAPTTYPAAIYWDSSNDCHSLITSRQVNTFLRQSAASTFGLNPDGAEVKKWSTHSIRVTAANLLHRAKFSDSYIKNRLRWRSDAFLMYLRNTFYTASDHSKALDLDVTPDLPNDTRPLEDHERVVSLAA